MSSSLITLAISSRQHVITISYPLHLGFLYLLFHNAPNHGGRGLMKMFYIGLKFTLLFSASRPIMHLSSNFCSLQKNLLWLRMRKTQVFGYEHRCLGDSMTIQLFSRLTTTGSTTGTLTSSAWAFGLDCSTRHEIPSWLCTWPQIPSESC